MLSVIHPPSNGPTTGATSVVIAHVPWSGETARSPAIDGIDTLAIDVSSTFMNVASDSATVPSASVAPLSGAACADGAAGEDVAGLSADALFECGAADFDGVA